MGWLRPSAQQPGRREVGTKTSRVFCMLALNSLQPWQVYRSGSQITQLHSEGSPAFRGASCLQRALMLLRGEKPGAALVRRASLSGRWFLQLLMVLGAEKARWFLSGEQGFCRCLCCGPRVGAEVILCGHHSHQMLREATPPCPGWWGSWGCFFASLLCLILFYK